jgi:1-acyl-sn-glycerol-3-phosphate acyltransferase
MHRLEHNGPAPLPEHGPAILIANHTCGIDHMILQAGCRRVLGFMIAQEFYNIWLCRQFCVLLRCIPVKRDGKDVAATRAALRALADGRVLPIFPEGKIHPNSGRDFGEPKPGAAFIALKAKVPVIPAYIRGTPMSNHVYKSLAIPSNARILFGTPIDLSDAYAAADHLSKDQVAAVSVRLMDAIKALRDRSLTEDA